MKVVLGQQVYSSLIKFFIFGVFFFFFCSLSGVNLKSVSLKRKTVFVRTGPGLQYPILWVYKKQYLPLKVLKSHDNWRYIVDFQNQKGWIHCSLLSNKKTVIIKKQINKCPILLCSSIHGHPIAQLHPYVIANVLKRKKNNILIKVVRGAKNWKGWVNIKNVWG